MQVGGRIIAVQEQRFRLRTNEGQVYLLTLAATARLDASDLARLQIEERQLSIQFDGEPNLKGGVARKVLVGSR
jgi:hypothetical protein